MNFVTKARTYWKLGPQNLRRAAWYSLRRKAGYFQRTMKIGEPVSGVFLSPCDQSTLEALRKRLDHWDVVPEYKVFGYLTQSFEQVPNWHRSMLTHQEADGIHSHWSTLPDFDSKAGDIKGIWEPSRMGWLIELAQNYVVSSDIQYLNTANTWIENWSANNPVNQGPNWKCAQEASLRMLHFAAAAMITSNKHIAPSAAIWVQQHIDRILPTLGYAKAQDNNHGTSEAAALYICASWLQTSPELSSKRLSRIVKQSEAYLQERVTRLVMPDGSFSQYSVTYHRLLLDTLNFVELWRRFLDLPSFSLDYLNQADKAATWLFEMTDPISGDAPNLGANDGAHILNFFGADYRDFRYTVELSCLLFRRRKAFSGVVNECVASRFNLSAIGEMPRNKSQAFEDGGYALTRTNDTWALLRLPIFQFRPSHADALHLDVWHKGENVLRDGGTFSYNTDEEWLHYFSGNGGHNTANFDGLPQMPKISRFLFAYWPRNRVFQCKQTSQQEYEMSSGFTLWHGPAHKREVVLSDKQVTIVDRLEGAKTTAGIQWRLMPAEWQQNDNSIQHGDTSITVTADVPIAEFALAQGFESRYYGEKTTLPVLNVTVSSDATITTIIRWK